MAKKEGDCERRARRSWCEEVGEDEAIDGDRVGDEDDWIGGNQLSGGGERKINLGRDGSCLGDSRGRDGVGKIRWLGPFFFSFLESYI